MTRQTEPERDRRSTAVSSDDNPRLDGALRSVVAEDNASRGRLSRGRVDERAAHGDVRLELHSRGERLLDQRPVELSANKRTPVQALGIAPFDGDAVAGHEHAVDAETF